MFPESARPV